MQVKGCQGCQKSGDAEPVDDDHVGEGDGAEGDRRGQAGKRAGRADLPDILFKGLLDAEIALCQMQPAMGQMH